MKQVISLVAIISLMTMGSYLIFEPEFTKGQTAENIIVTQEVTGEVSVVCDDSVSGLTPILGISGGTSNGTFNCTSTTNHATGYTLRLRRITQLCRTPACLVNERFDDYPGTTSDPIDFAWADAGAGAEYWGFNMTAGADVTRRFRDNNGAAPCNTDGGTVTAGRCWVRIPDAAPGENVARSTGPTPTAGTLSSFGIRIQAGPNNHLHTGIYNATLTATVITNP